MKVFQDMENEFYAEVRRELLDGLLQCTTANHRFFKLMYARPEQSSVEKKESQSIQRVVEKMPREKLDWAMQQVQRTIDRKTR